MINSLTIMRLVFLQVEERRQKRKIKYLSRQLTNTQEKFNKRITETKLHLKRCPTQMNSILKIRSQFCSKQGSLHPDSSQMIPVF